MVDLEIADTHRHPVRRLADRSGSRGTASSGHRGFYIIFAFAVTASVQLVGVYLVFASLIIPALAARHLHGPKRLWTGYLLGSFAYLAGILLSAWFDLPTGAVTVWTMAILAVVVSSFLGYKLNKRTQREAGGN